MKAQKKIIFAIFFILFVWGVVSFFIIRGLDTAAIHVPYSDSIQLRIDTVKVNIVKCKNRVKYIRETDTIVYDGTDTICSEIIERKTRLINALDTLTFELDKEAQLFSDMVQVEIRRNATLSDSISTITLNYKGSLKNQAKTIKKERRRTFFYKLTTTAAVAIGLYGIVK